jgi:hypothetical protein
MSMTFAGRWNVQWCTEGSIGTSQNVQSVMKAVSAMSRASPESCTIFLSVSGLALLGLIQI